MDKEAKAKGRLSEGGLKDSQEKEKEKDKEKEKKEKRVIKGYFKNPYLDTKFLNAGGIPPDDIKAHLFANLDRLNQFEVIGSSDPNNPNSKEFTVYVGDAGIALAYYRSAQVFSEKGKESLSIRYLNYAREKIRSAAENMTKYHLRHTESKKEITFLEGAAGVHAVAALLYKHDKKDNEMMEEVKQVQNLYSVIEKIDSCELLYGKVGYLYTLLFIMKHIYSDNILEDLATKVLTTVVKIGKDRTALPSTFPLMYQWHDKKYLGGAHGISGILYVLLQFPKCLQNEELVNDIKATIDKIINLEKSDGNYPSKEGDKNSDLVQWCHGSPAIVLLYAKAYELWKNEKWLDAAKRGAKLIWEKGLLKKGLGLCHGMSGNGYVLLTLYNITKEYHYYQKALCFAQFSWGRKGTSTLHTPDTPLSLFEGMAGMMCFIADCLNPAQASIPGVDL